MSAIEYAVTNPATGEKLKTFDTISDDELQAAIGRAHDARHGWGRDTSVEERAKVIARVAELHTERRESSPRSSPARWASRSSRPLGEVDFSAAIYQYYADNAAKLLADEPIDLLDGEGSAFIRRSSVGLLLGIMPWNYPYYQVARFAGPNLVIGNTILLKHAPQCPESAAAMEQIFHDAGVPRTRTSTSTRPTSRSSGSSATRACRACRSPAPAARARRWPRSRAAPQEGRARARRLGPVHRARRRRPRRGRRAGRRRPAGEHRPGLQRRQALHRRRRPLRRLRREVHRRADRGRAGRSDVLGHGDRAAVLDRRRRTGWRRRSSRPSTPARRSPRAAAATATSSRPP